jgi:hypothetical protein
MYTFSNVTKGQLGCTHRYNYIHRQHFLSLPHISIDLLYNFPSSQSSIKLQHMLIYYRHLVTNQRLSRASINVHLIYNILKM